MNVFIFASLLCCVVTAVTAVENEADEPTKTITASPFNKSSSPSNQTTQKHLSTAKPPPPKPTTAKPPPPKPTTAKPPPPKPTTAKPPPPKPTTAKPPPPKPTTAKPPPPKPTTAKPPPPKPTTTKPPPPKPTTTKPPPPKSTTAKPPPPKPTTAKPPPPKPTTAKPPPPKPTTAKPPPPKPTPPKPTPSTPVTVGNYSIMSKDKKSVCLKAQMALQVRLVSKENNGTFTVNPNKTKGEGFCAETKANLTLVFPEGFITFLFNKSVGNNTVYADTVSFDINYPMKTGSKNSAKNTSMHLFSAKIGNSYSCKTESVYMGNGFHLDVTKDRLQAFNFSKSNDFGFPDHCLADQPDYRIPVAVGLTLLVLIVIVLVVYLVSRRRRTDGYQTL